MGRIVLNHGHINACAFRTLFKMTISTQFVTLQVLATLYSTVEALNTATNNKAASQYVNCDCQCSSLTFQDKFGRTQGNCKTADNTGATWCYVDSRSSCLDKQRSVRFSQSGHAWSYQACSTPPRHSAQCSGFGSSSNFQQGEQVLPCGWQLPKFFFRAVCNWIWIIRKQRQLSDRQHRELPPRSELQRGQQQHLRIFVRRFRFELERKHCQLSFWAEL